MSNKPGDTAANQPKAGSESHRTGSVEPTAAERRAQALRDNLRRRKAQSRARSAGRDGESPPDN